jgi:hypothetical protein
MKFDISNYESSVLQQTAAAVLFKVCLTSHSSNSLSVASKPTLDWMDSHVFGGLQEKEKWGRISLPYISNCLYVHMKEIENPLHGLESVAEIFL